MYCLNLKISWMKKSVTSVLIQSTMTKLNLHLKLIWLLTVYNLFLLQVAQKCQCCQLCVLRENSNVVCSLRRRVRGMLLYDNVDTQ